MSVKALICDDDTECRELTVDYFVRYCEDRGINYSYDSCDNAQDAIISEKAYDIAFLDVELGEKTGLDVAKFLKIRNKNVIIFFITEYEKYIDDRNRRHYCFQTDRIRTGAGTFHGGYFKLYSGGQQNL